MTPRIELVEPNSETRGWVRVNGQPMHPDQAIQCGQELIEKGRLLQHLREERAARNQPKTDGGSW